MKFFAKIAALLLVMASFGAHAQGQFSDQKLKAFGKAYQEIRTINQKFKTKAKSAKKPQNVQKLQTKAQGKMKKAIKNNGLTIAEYTSIMEKAQSDKELQKKIFN